MGTTITQDHIDFVAECIASGERESEHRVRVDVLLIGERFGVTWAVARSILQASAKALGHRMAGPKSSVVDTSPRESAAAERHAISKIDAMINASAELMAASSRNIVNPA